MTALAVTSLAHCRLLLGHVRAVPRPRRLPAAVRHRAAQRPTTLGRRCRRDRSARSAFALAVQPAGVPDQSTGGLDVRRHGGGLAGRGEPAPPPGPLGRAGGAGDAARARARGADPPGGGRGAAADRPRAARRRRPLDERHRRAVRGRQPRHRHPARPRPSGRWPRSRPPAATRWPRCAGCSACCVTRARTADAALEPAPGLVDLDQLVDQVRAAGSTPRSRSTGRATEVPGCCRTVRVPHRPGGADQRAQARRPECARHGRLHRGRGGHRGRSTTADAARRRRSPPGTALRPGHGLIGMRERVAVFGGELRGRSATRAAASRSARGCRWSAPRRCAVIRVVVADDQALVRAGFRVLVDSADDLTWSARPPTAPRRSSSPLRAAARRRADGHPDAGDGRAGGDPADRRGSDAEAYACSC